MTSAEEKKEALLRDLIIARSRLVKAATALSPAKQDRVFLGTWSAKHLLAHLIGWDYTNVQAIEEISAGKVPSFYSHYDQNWASYNAQLVAQYGKEKLEDLLADLQASHRQLLERVDALPATDLWRDRKLRFRGWKVTIGSLLDVEARDEAEHADQLEAWAQS
ncbi:MAG: ClbS/DfsB family four-helix bundle protein [Chloroflexota bacterium]